MKKILWVFSLVGLIICSCDDSKKQDAMVKADSLSPLDSIKRGEYLVTAIGCTDCHTSRVMTPNGPQPDMSRLLSGYPQDEKLAPYDSVTSGAYILFNQSLTATVGPWGTSFAANITPDETGIGSWTNEQFLLAMKEGQWKGLKGSRKLLTPMPWQNFAKLSDEDVLAMFAYLKTLKPVKNAVPQALPPS